MSQYIDETSMLFAPGTTPKELTNRWTLRLKATLKPVNKDTEFEFSLTVVGRAKLYIDGELIIDNWTQQRKGTAFLGQGTVEERGVAILKAGQKHELFVDFSNERGPGSASAGGGPPISAVRIGGAQVLDEEKTIEESVRIAESADRVIVFVGLNGDWESGGFDRSTLRLPGRMDELVEKIAAVAREKTIVVTQSVSLSFREALALDAHHCVGLCN